MKTNPNPTALLLSGLLSSLALSFAAGCNATTRGTDVAEHKGPWAGDEIQNASMNLAIISQHTLYPYHFVTGSPELNELGQRDLNVLADHFVKVGGDLNVRRGDATQALYEGRVKSVLERLSSAGVGSDAVAIKDGLPGGEGIASERVIVILKERMSPTDSDGMTTSSTSILP